MPTRKRFDSMSARDTGLEYLLRRLDRLEGNPGLVARDTRRTGGTGGGVDPTFLVAASDASPGMRAAADWVCTGSGDQVEIQAAFNALPVAGGRVQLSEGTFSITGIVSVPAGAEIAGVGNSTVLNVNSNWNGLNLGAQCTVRNLTIDLTSETAGNRYGIYVAGAYSRIESCRFRGMRTSGQDYLAYIGMGELTTIIGCEFLDIGSATAGGRAIEYFAGNITGCEFVGAATGAVPQAIYLFTSTSDGAGVISANTFKDCKIFSESFSFGVTIADNLFWQDVTSFTDAVIDLYDPSSLNIHNNTVLPGGVREFLLVTGPSFSWCSYVSIKGNTVTGGRIRIPAGLVSSEIVGNALYDYAEIDLYSTLTNRDVDGVVIAENLIGTLGSGHSGRIAVTGTDQRVAALIIRGNTLFSQDRPTSWGVDSAPIIDIDMGDDLLVSWNKVAHVNGNVIYHNRTSNTIDSALGINIVGRAAGAQDLAIVADNTLYGSDGINVQDQVTAHVKGNSLLRNRVNPTHSGAQQITIRATSQVVVANNTVEAGDDTGAPDPAGTKSVIHVDAVSGVVHDNDVWAQNQGALDTFITYANALMEVDNRYHGKHSAQAGSVLTNGTAVGTASGSGGTASVVFTGTATGAVV